MPNFSAHSPFCRLEIKIVITAKVFGEKILRSMDEENNKSGGILSCPGSAEGVGKLSVISSYRGTLLLTKGDNYLNLPLSPPQLNLQLCATIQQNSIEIKAISQFENSFIPVTGKGCSEGNIFIFENAIGKYSTREGWLFIRATGGVVFKGEGIGHMEFDYVIANGISQYQFYGFEQ